MAIRLSPIRRYRPPLGSTQFATPMMPGGMFGLNNGPDSFGDLGPIQADDDVTYQDDDPAVTVTQPQLNRSGPMAGAAKVNAKPPAMAGGPQILPDTVNVPQAVTDGAEEDSPEDAPTTPTPAGPPAMAGGPPQRNLVTDLQAEREAAKMPDKPKTSKWQMLAAAGLGAAEGWKNAARPHDPQSHVDWGSVIHPKYAADVAQYGAKVRDIDDRLNTAIKAEGAESLRAERIGREEDRKIAGVLRKDALAEKTKNNERDDSERNFKQSIEFANMGAMPKVEGDPLTPGAIRLKNPTDPSGKAFLDIIPTRGTKKVTDPDMAKDLRVDVGEEVPQSLYLEGVKFAQARELAKLTQPVKEETPEIKNYKMAVSQGYKGTLLDYEKEKANFKEKSDSGGGTWTLAEDPATGEAIEHNSKTGEIRKPMGGIQRSGTKAKADADEEKRIGPGRDALAYADDYLKSKAYTGMGDLALQEKFFEVAKPSSGFRQNQAVMQKLADSASWMNSLRGKAYHAATGRWFSDTQREEIVGAMKSLQRAKADGKENQGRPSLGSIFGVEEK